MKNLRLMIAAMALCTLGLLSTPASAQPKEIVLWHGYRAEEKAALEKVLKQFNDANKGIVVKPLAVPYDAYADKISATVPRGKGPDLFIFAQDRLGGWIEAGNTVEPIDFYLDRKLRVPTLAQPGRQLVTSFQNFCAAFLFRRNRQDHDLRRRNCSDLAGILPGQRVAGCQ